MLKKIIMAPLRLLEAFADRAAALFGALIFLQFPQFFVQYLQRLGGHSDELERVVGQYLDAAKTSGESIESYIGLHLKSSIPEFAKSGKIMARNFTRSADLGNALKELTSCSPWTKFFVFLKNFDFDIARSTAENFVPGIPLSIESAAYALFGMACAMCGYYYLKKLIRIIAGKIAGAPRAGQSGRA